MHNFTFQAKNDGSVSNFTLAQRLRREREKSTTSPTHATKRAYTSTNNTISTACVLPQTPNLNDYSVNAITPLTVESVDVMEVDPEQQASLDQNLAEEMLHAFDAPINVILVHEEADFHEDEQESPSIPSPLNLLENILSMPSTSSVPVHG